jgi:hypothetical protein
MSKMARTALGSLIALLVASTVSGAPLPGFSLAAQTPHFSFYTRDGQKVDSSRSEAFLLKVSQLLGQNVEGRAEYFRYSTPEQVAVGTGTYADGLTFPETHQIHSTQDFHAHEIVHLVAGSLGRPGTFFQEGLAVALGNEGRWNGKKVDAIAKPAARRVHVSALVSGFDRMDPQDAYPLAGSFVARLIKTHGIEAVTRFFRACKGNNTEAAFASAFGQSLDAAGTDWAQSL